MALITAYQDRIRRGVHLFTNGHVQPSNEPGSFDVASQFSASIYHVQVAVEDGGLVSIKCDCPDCRKMQEAIDHIIDYGGTQFHPGISHLWGDALCKHGVACLIEMGFLSPPM